MTPGVNKPGGTARVVKVDATTGAVDVRYVVEGGWERGIDPRYVSPATLELNEKRSTLGRCIHCGSLRIDCRQECEFFTTPSPNSPPLYLSGEFPDGSDERGGLPGGSAGETTQRRRRHQRERERERGRERERERERRRRHRHRRPRPPSEEGGGGDPGERGDQLSESQKRRRHLPEDWDEEGDPVLGSSQEAGEGARGGDNSDGDVDSDAPVTGNGRKRGSRSGRRLVDSGSNGSSSSSDGGTMNIEGPRRRRLAGRPDRNDFEGLNSDDSYVECLGVGGSTSRGRGGGSSRRGRFDNSNRYFSDGSGFSESERSREEEEEEEEDGSTSLSTCIPRRSSTRGGADDKDDLADGGAIEARFLQAEGEEDALPPDIRDPTRGVKDRSVLRTELQRLLKQMEECDATELEDDVGAVCR